MGVTKKATPLYQWVRLIHHQRLGYRLGQLSFIKHCWCANYDGCAHSVGYQPKRLLRRYGACIVAIHISVGEFLVLSVVVAMGASMTVEVLVVSRGRIAIYGKVGSDESGQKSRVRARVFVV